MVFAAIAAIAIIASTYFFVANYVYVSSSQQTLKGLSRSRCTS
jgi:cytochrome c-type biogenesis protein CcmH/NrfG